MDTRLQTPLDKKALAGLRAGDNVLLSGEIYTARDAAHGRMAERINAGKQLPFPLDGACIYYAGPTPAPPGMAIGSVGPTTAGRMDKHTPLLLANGLCAMVGKGQRGNAVIDAIRKYKAVYFGFIGGAGALAAACVEKSELVAWEELGSEAIYRLTVKDFPLVVLVDSLGSDLYAIGPKQYLASRAGGGAEKQPPKAAGKLNTVDEYLASLGGEAKEWAETFVRFMRENYPGVSEGLSYQIPTYISESTLMAFSVTKTQFTFQVANGAVLDELREKMPYASFGKNKLRVPLERTDARLELLIKAKEMFEG